MVTSQLSAPTAGVLRYKEAHSKGHGWRNDTSLYLMKTSNFEVFTDKL